MKMTALEMAETYGWVELTVNFGVTGYLGHVCVEGKTRIVRGKSTTAVWVGNLCLSTNAVVHIPEIIGTDGAKACVYQHDQNHYQNHAA